MLFIEYPKCSTCQKAKCWLDENGVAYTDRHIVEENPTMEELKAWQAASGLPDEQLHLLATDGMLVKRPLVVGDDFVLVGFKPDEWASTLK